MPAPRSMAARIATTSHSRRDVAPAELAQRLDLSSVGSSR